MAALEARLVGVIVHVGDKQLGELNAQLRNLARHLQDDLDTHTSLIVDTIFDCARSLQTKSMVYGTLSGLLNAHDSAVGAAIVVSAHRELDQALDDHAPMAIRGLTRFVVELMNAHVVAASTVVELIDAYLAVRTEESAPQARVDWFMVLVLDALVLGGKYLRGTEPAELERLLREVRKYAERRVPLRSAAPLLMPYDEATNSSEVVEHFDALWDLVQCFAEDGGWSSPCLLTPHRAFASELEASSSHRMRLITVPAHTPGCTYPMLHRIRLLSAPKERSRSSFATEEMEDVNEDSVERRGALGAAERTIMEEFTWMIVHAFCESHRDAGATT
ncbi:MAG: hypothetical protein SGPRY_003164 [Prymnesium sp.]